MNRIIHSNINTNDKYYLLSIECSFVNDKFNSFEQIYKKFFIIFSSDERICFNSSPYYYFKAKNELKENQCLQNIMGVTTFFDFRKKLCSEIDLQSSQFFDLSNFNHFCVIFSKGKLIFIELIARKIFGYYSTNLNIIPQNKVPNYTISWLKQNIIILSDYKSLFKFFKLYNEFNILGFPI